jgi:hypothetical protein
MKNLSGLINKLKTRLYKESDNNELCKQYEEEKEN